MGERHRQGLLTTLLSRVARIETEPHEPALRRHLQRIVELDRQRQVLLTAFSNPHDGQPVENDACLRTLNDIGDEIVRRKVKGPTPVRQLVIFNSKRLSL